mgnify:CR=1 FL=1
MIKLILIIVGGFVGLILAIVIGVAVYLKTLDFNQYKDLIIEQARDATGRKLVIAGDLNVELGFSPAIAANGVSFANAPWGTRSSMAIFDRFEAQVGLIPLLLGDVVVDRILLKDADIFIERDAQGRVNYDFGAVAQKSAKKQAEKLKATIRAGADAVALPKVHRLAVENAKITYKDAKTKKTTVIAIKSMTMFAESMTTPVEFRIDGSLGKQPIDVKAKLGSFTDMFAPLKPWAISAEIDVIGATVLIEGEINDPFKLRGLNVVVTIEGESLNEASRLFGYDFQDKEYSIEVTFNGDADKNLSLRTFYFRMLGGSRFAGNLLIDFTKEHPSVKGKIISNRFNYADFTNVPEGGEKSAKKGPAPVRLIGSRVFSADRFPLEALKTVDLDLQVIAKKVAAKGVVVGNLQIGIELKNGSLHIAPFKGNVAKGSFNGGLNLNAAEATPNMKGRLSLRKVNLGKLLTDLAITDLLEGKLNAKVSFRGKGASARDLMAGLGGDVKLSMGKGRFNTPIFDNFIGGPTQMLKQITTGKQRNFSVVNCMIGQMDIEKGQATLNGAVLDTGYAMISGKGGIDLKTESLDITVTPKSKSSTLKASMPVEIRGTLADPAYGVDKLKAAQNIGGASLGFTFPPEILMGLGEIGAYEESPCMRAARGKKPPRSRRSDRRKR